MSVPRRRLGLFGGSFDPIHEGHLHAAREAQRAFALDRVVFMPAFRSPFKLGRRPAAAEHRLAMVERAIAGSPGWSVSTLELQRGGTSYTIDTVRDLRAACGEPADAELFLILGSDNLPGLAGWRDVRELLTLAQPIVVYRADGDARPGDPGSEDIGPGDPGPGDPGPGDIGRGDPGRGDVSPQPRDELDALRERLGEDLARRVERGFLRLPPVEVSSTELRAQLAARTSGKTAAVPDVSEHVAGVTERVPAAVLKYIREHGLYRAS